MRLDYNFRIIGESLFSHDWLFENNNHPMINSALIVRLLKLASKYDVLRLQSRLGQIQYINVSLGMPETNCGI
jgi:hypothetical protein